ncbi:hypothetical protein U9M48_007382 [Paspalum notatum var. saurae]|uniref:CW-type domain-containing protein n=1 Tax=Paspalum notatum var. saurae TaxID=547442 RepID=A0AAQ3Q0F1_PASNO
MLSLRGGARRERAEELEEGEARSDSDSDADADAVPEAFFDPDVALSYIDEKLQRVLGHVQKEFEGGVSAEGLGSKFGGYGSFLPAYQHSPSLSQSRSPHIAADIGTSTSPYQPSTERMDQNPSTVAVNSISRNNGSGPPSTSCLHKKQRCSSTNDEETAADSDSADSSFSGTDSKSLKVQAKVCSKNDLPRKKTPTYSDLGLDISSSMEESSDGLGGLSPEFSNVPYESPRTILQVMTCFPVPGGFLLSPLCGNLLQLANKVTPMLKNLETRLSMENVPTELERHSQSPRPPGPVRGHVDKQMKLTSRKMVPMDTKNRKDKGDTSGIVNKEVNVQMLACQEIIPDIPARKAEIERVSQFIQETTINRCISRPSHQNDNVRLKDQTVGDDRATVKAGLIKGETLKYAEKNNVDNLRTGMLTAKQGSKSKICNVSIDLEQGELSHHKPSSFDCKRKNKVKYERKFEVALTDCDYNDSMTKEWCVGSCDDLRNVPVKKIFSSNRAGHSNPQTEFKRMHEERHVSATVSYDLMEDDNCTHSSAADMNRENATGLKSGRFEKKAKSHNNADETLPSRCQGDMEGELCQNEKIMNTNNKNEFDVGSARKEIPTSVNHRQLHMLSTSGVATMNADSVPAPVVIEEHWVCCDMCQKWRLLPYGTNPSMLPKKWKCSMLYWLPGMNRCDISEDVTTEALNALYTIPAPAPAVSSGGRHAVGAGTATSSAYNMSGQFEQSRKRKNAPTDGDCLAESSYHTQLSTPLMSNQQNPSRNKRTTDGMHHSFEGDSMNKHGLKPVSRTADLISEKQKNHSSYSDGGISDSNKFHGSLKGISDSNNKKIPQSACAQVSEITASLDNSLPKVSWRKDLTVNDIGVGRGGGQLCSGDKKGLATECAAPQPGQNLFDRKSITLNTESGPVTHESKNIETCKGSGTVQRLGMSFKKEKSHLRIVNQDIQNLVAQVVNMPKKESKQKVCPTSVKSDSLKMEAKLMKSHVKRGVQHNIIKQVVSNPSDTNPMKKDGSMVAFALKEARDLKHKANDLKNKGYELESIGLYFEAALKFLHVAFLLETPSFDCSRPGNARSMKMYSETAKLCNFCAYEYERFKKMAAAALAYKCVEVAYLKVAYYKHPSANKDQQELQAAVQMSPGESSSSYASDVDNLNSHGLSKASSRNCGDSPQVPGRHLPLAVHNQAHLLRLLAYTNDVNLAFDATRKSELVIASAAGNQERGSVDDGLASIKTVLDLNFSNVNELLRLVRVSMESISWKPISITEITEIQIGADTFGYTLGSLLEAAQGTGDCLLAVLTKFSFTSWTRLQAVTELLDINQKSLEQ